MWARALLVLVLLAPGAWAQDAGAPAVLVVDQERLFAESAYGLGLQDLVEARLTALDGDNRRIEDELEGEEQELAEARQTMEPDAFGELAAAFDIRVEELRVAQEQKEREVAVYRRDAVQFFYGEVVGVLESILSEQGAQILLDRRSVLLTRSGADITDLAIERINARLGDRLPPGAPEP